MATFKATIKKDKMKSDKTWHVYILFSHKSKNAYIPTTMFVTQKDLTASGKIKNRSVLDRCEDIIRMYRQKIEKLNLELNDVEFKSIVDFIKSKDINQDLSFTEYSNKWLANSKIKGLKNYKTALNSFKRFMGKENIYFSEITSQKMKEYTDSLCDKPRSQSLYTNAIVKIFNDARNYYNDDENNIIRIRHTLSKFHTPRQNVAEKRALDVNTIRKIFELPYDNLIRKGFCSRRDLALDCYKLSFCLMGMNSADLYNATQFDGEYITYNRTKTKDRRNDKAEMVIRVHPSIMPILNKYRGHDHVFNFSSRFSSMSDFNRSLNIGLKSIAKEIGIDDLQFYSARHSMATIAVNDVGISIYLVNEMLCHIDRSIKITMLYIKKDNKSINDANFKLIDYILSK